MLLSVESHVDDRAFAPPTARSLWTAEHHRGGHMSPDDMLVINGLVWSGDIADGERLGDLHRPRPAHRRGAERVQRPTCTPIGSIIAATAAAPPTSISSPRAPGSSSSTWRPSIGTSTTGSAAAACTDSCRPTAWSTRRRTTAAASWNRSCSASTPWRPNRPAGKLPREVPDGGRLERGPAYAASRWSQPRHPLPPPIGPPIGTTPRGAERCRRSCRPS